MSVSISKHIEKRGPVYYFRAMVHGKRYFQSLRTGDKILASARARELHKAALAENYEVLDDVKTIKGHARLGAVLEIYRKTAQLRDMKERTADDYIRSLKIILRSVYPAANPENLSTDILNRDLVEKYCLKTLEAVGKAGDKRDRARRSALSTLRQARALFSGWAMEAYDRNKLKLPETLAEFMKSEGLQSRVKTYRLPPRELIDKTKKEGLKLKEDRPELYAVYLLAYYLGLRAGEAAAAKWSWLRGEMIEGQVYQVMDVIRRADFVPKGRERSIPVGQKVMAELDALRNGSEYILDGKAAGSRENLVKRRFSKWMRSIGWSGDEYPKAAHELRKLMGSEWYSNLGAEVAQSWLGHKDISTTCQFYAALTRRPPPIDMD